MTAETNDPPAWGRRRRRGAAGHWSPAYVPVPAGDEANGFADTTLARKLRVWSLLVSIATLALLMLYRESLAALPLRTLSAVACAISVALAALVYLNSSRSVWSLAFSFVAVYWLFHFGMTFAVAAGTQSVLSEARSAPYRWFFRAQTRPAIVLAAVGTAACAAGILLASMMTAARARRSTPAAAAEDADLRRRLPVVGLTVLLLALLGWFAVVLLTGGLGMLVSNYHTYLISTVSMPTGLIIYSIGIGMIFLAVSPPGPVRTTGFVAFAFWALFAFPIGLRGEVLFPLVTALAVVARRKIPLSAAKTAVIALVVLVAIAVVKDLRQVGVAKAEGAWIDANPVNALTEMGGSLWPVVESIIWAEQGDRPFYGATYWAPFDRAITRVLPLWKRLPADQDERIQNIVIMERTGPIGFSVVAEAYRNFGDWGVPLVMGLVGLLLGWMDRLPSTAVWDAVVGIVLVELLFHVRNDFIAVPAHVLGALALLGAVRFAARYSASRGGGRGFEVVSPSVAPSQPPPGPAPAPAPAGGRGAP